MFGPKRCDEIIRLIDHVLADCEWRQTATGQQHPIVEARTAGQVGLRDVSSRRRPGFTIDQKGRGETTRRSSRPSLTRPETGS